MEALTIIGISLAFVVGMSLGMKGLSILINYHIRKHFWR